MSGAASWTRYEDAIVEWIEGPVRDDDEELQVLLPGRTLTAIRTRRQRLGLSTCVLGQARRPDGSLPSPVPSRPRGYSAQSIADADEAPDDPQSRLILAMNKEGVLRVAQ